jgi:hypothetical protein
MLVYCVADVGFTKLETWFEKQRLDPPFFDASVIEGVEIVYASDEITRV